MSTDLKSLKQMERKICILHYACSTIKETPVKISSIALIEYHNNKSHIFSQVEHDEKDLLEQFYNFMTNHPDYALVGWNLKNIIFGVEVINRRYKQVMGMDAPTLSNKVYDLDEIFQNTHGHSYVSHGTLGKMHNLFVLNDINVEQFLYGGTEAELFEQRAMRKIELSNVCKADGIKNVVKLSFKNKLKIGNKKNSIIRFINSTSFKLIAFGAQIAAFFGIGS